MGTMLGQPRNARPGTPQSPGATFPQVAQMSPMQPGGGRSSPTGPGPSNYGPYAMPGAPAGGPVNVPMQPGPAPGNPGMNGPVGLQPQQPLPLYTGTPAAMQGAKLPGQSTGPVTQKPQSAMNPQMMQLAQWAQMMQQRGRGGR